MLVGVDEENRRALGGKAVGDDAGQRRGAGGTPCADDEDGQRLAVGCPRLGTHAQRVDETLDRRRRFLDRDGRLEGEATVVHERADALLAEELLGLRVVDDPGRRAGRHDGHEHAEERSGDDAGDDEQCSVVTDGLAREVRRLDDGRGDARSGVALELGELRLRLEELVDEGRLLGHQRRHDLVGARDRQVAVPRRLDVRRQRRLDVGVDRRRAGSGCLRSVPGPAPRRYRLPAGCGRGTRSDTPGRSVD